MESADGSALPLPAALGLPKRAKPASSCATTKGKLIQRIVMRFLTVLLALIPTCALALELFVEDRACITAAANKLPPVTALGIKGSRALPQPQQSKGRATRMYIASCGDRCQCGWAKFDLPL
jgi:hypothetical protein